MASGRKALDAGLTPAEYGDRLDRCLYELGRLVGTPDEAVCLRAAQQIAATQQADAQRAGDLRLAGYLAATVQHLGTLRVLFDLGDQDQAS